MQRQEQATQTEARVKALLDQEARLLEEVRQFRQRQLAAVGLSNRSNFTALDRSRGIIMPSPGTVPGSSTASISAGISARISERISPTLMTMMVMQPQPQATTNMTGMLSHHNSPSTLSPLPVGRSTTVANFDNNCVTKTNKKNDSSIAITKVGLNTKVSKNNSNADNMVEESMAFDKIVASNHGNSVLDVLDFQARSILAMGPSNSATLPNKGGGSSSSSSSSSRKVISSYKDSGELKKGEDHHDTATPPDDDDNNKNNNGNDDDDDDDDKEDDDDDKLTDELYFSSKKTDPNAGKAHQSPQPPAREPFPIKLYRIIHEAKVNNQEDIISFFPHGRAFAVHKPKEFIRDIMPKYFPAGRMNTFLKQLNLYGFRRITE